MRKRNFPSFLLYALGFFLIWEWIRPMEELTDTDHIGFFIFFLLLSFAFVFINVKWFWQLIIKLLYILYSINLLYYKEAILDFSWVKAFFGDVITNTGMLFAQNWSNLSAEFRSLLFFLLLWIMVYLIHYWLINRQRMFLFFFMTLIYITVLDTFTPYSAKFAIVRTVVAGFIIMGMLTFYRLTTKENVNKDYAGTRKWMVPLAGMVALSVLVGITAPKAAPIWADPIPYLKGDHKYGTRDGAGDVKKIGYGQDDTHLGGPFLGDNRTVFQIEAKGQNYWKVETKDLYTGKGWIASGSTSVQFKLSDIVPVISFPKTVETTHEVAKVTAASHSNYPFIIYPAGIKQISKISPNYGDNNIFEMDTAKDKINAFDDKNKPIVPALYSINFDIPKYKASELRKTKTFDPSAMSVNFYQRYTQVPKEVPPRIKQLTEKITAGESNWFDKAKAVEQYFSSPEFTYDQKDVTFPGQNQDYVDQFLFETKRGYCDNFSSSMAIMLRTIGIPTRWVKGYNGGKFLKYSDTDPSKQIYNITNNNAHSWVEVFFPNQGWVPFEPTKGFSNNLNIDYLSNGTIPKDTKQATPMPVKKPQKNLLDEPNKSQVTIKSDKTSIWEHTKAFLKSHWRIMVLFFIVIAGIIGILYRIRGKWYPYYLLGRYKFTKKDENISKTYAILLHQLERYGLKRKENQTLRSYARYVDLFFSTREMTRLTAKYEQYVYHHNLPHGTWGESRELWENLIKKTIA